MIAEPDGIVHLTALLSTIAPEYTLGMKSKFKWLLFLLLLVLHLADNPAYACSINEGIATETNMLLTLVFVLSAYLSVPVSLWFWRIKKIKARYTILPSLLAVLMALGIAAYMDQQASNVSAAIRDCTKMQKEGVQFLLH